MRELTDRPFGSREVCKPLQEAMVHETLVKSGSGRELQRAAKLLRGPAIQHDLAEYLPGHLDIALPHVGFGEMTPRLLLYSFVRQRGKYFLGEAHSLFGVPPQVSLFG